MQHGAARLRGELHIPWAQGSVMAALAGTIHPRHIDVFACDSMLVNGESSGPDDHIEPMIHGVPATMCNHVRACACACAAPEVIIGGQGHSFPADIW